MQPNSRSISGYILLGSSSSSIIIMQSQFATEKVTYHILNVFGCVYYSKVASVYVTNIEMTTGKVRCAIMTIGFCSLQ